VQQRDHEAVDRLARRQLLDRFTHRLVVERRVDAPVGAKSLEHLGDPRARDHRQRARAVQIERVRQPQALELEDVAEPLGDEQAEPRTGSLDQRVHRDRRAVDDSADLTRLDAVLVGQARQPDTDGLSELVRGRGDLQAEQLARLGVEEGEVGEGAADVDSEPVPRHRCRDCAASAASRQASAEHHRGGYGTAARARTASRPPVK
jgi:hypothetical protein